MNNAGLEAELRDYDEIRFEYSFPKTPERLTAIWEELWTRWGDKIGMDIRPQSVSRIQAEQAVTRRGDLIVVPDALDLPTRAEELRVLREIFPHIKTHSTPAFYDAEGDSTSGVFLVDLNPVSPNLGTDEEELMNRFISRREKPMGLKEYIIASEFRRIVAERPLDARGSWSRLPGTTIDGRTAIAAYTPDGGLVLDIHKGPEYRNGQLGGRSYTDLSIFSE